MLTTIYVRLTNEVINVWRPVLAEDIGSASYRLTLDQAVPQDEVWEFLPGQGVKVEKRELSEGEVLVAVEEV